MKLLILGGTGMAGHMLAIYLKENGHDVTTLSRSENDYCNNIIADVTDFKNLELIINEGNFDSIINAIGILNKSAEKNKAEAILVNSYLPHFLSQITNKSHTKIIHLSTDCVFSGKKGGYLENSFKDGESFYDRTKALGEIVNNKDLTFRTSIVGPDMRENGIGLFNWFMFQDNNIYGYTNVKWTGITTLTLAKAVEQAIEENITGIYNLVNNVTISKFELLSLFNRFIRENKISIIPDEHIVLDKSLINSRKDFSFKIPSYKNMVIEMKDWIYKHKNLYPYYVK